MRILLLILLALPAAWGEIRHVPEDHGTIQEAIDATSAGDTVQVAPGTWHENLVYPAHAICLTSNFLFSQDSLDIINTILDGDSLATVVTIQGTLDGQSILCGFTIQNGLGYWEGIGIESIGGGVHIQGDVSFLLRDLVFRDNVSPYHGSAIRNSPRLDNQSLVQLRNLKFEVNPIERVSTSRYAQVRLDTDASIHAQQLYIDGEFESKQGLYLTSGDSLVVKDLSVRNCDLMWISLIADSNVCVSDFQLLDCRNVAPVIKCLSGRLSCSNLRFEDNFWMSEHAFYGVWLNGELAIIDSIQFLNNRMNLADGESSSTIARIASYSERGSVSNMIMRYNTVDDSIPEGDSYGELAWLTSVNLLNSEFTDNHLHLNPSQNASREGVEGGMVKVTVLLPEEYVMQNVRFEDNLVTDRRDFSVLPDAYYPGIFGRSLYFIGTNSADTLTIRDLYFRNERSPNIAPEYSTTAGLAGVGNTFYLQAHPNVQCLTMENINIIDCDDGGMYVESGAWNQRLSGFQIVNVNRMGLLYDAYNADQGIHEISNGWIHNIVEQLAYMPYPYIWSIQRPAVITQDGDHLQLSNVTITDCFTNCFMITNAEWRNSIFSGNTYDHLFVPYYGDLGSSFSYCNLQEEMPGSFNQLDQDPLFDGAQPPMLSQSSPCIDAGNPDTSYNDSEDPGNPGFALWPSQGGIRSDMGVTGGPRAFLPEASMDIAHPRESGGSLAGEIRLSPAFPNPFNSSTRLQFELPHSGPLSIRLYNVRGQLVRVVLEQEMAAGIHELTLHAQDLASGVYFLHFDTLKETAVQKVLHLK